jgi:hypothetical protein
MAVENTIRTRAAADLHVQSNERPSLTDLPEGRFGRLFPDLPRQIVSGDALLKYGAGTVPWSAARTVINALERKVRGLQPAGRSSGNSSPMTSRPYPVTGGGGHREPSGFPQASTRS